MAKKSKWDHNTVEQAYHDLLEPIGSILDQAQNLGLPSLLDPRDPLVLYVKFIESIEQELFVQWKIKSEQGMERLLAHQRGFITADLRSQTGCFAQYARLRQAVLAEQPKADPDGWTGLLIERMADQASYPPFGLAPEAGQPLWSLLKEMMEFSPEHCWLGLLNLCELGAGPRFEPLGFAQPAFRPGALGPIFPALHQCADLQALETQLLAFWQHNSGGLFSRYAAFLFEPGPDQQGLLIGQEIHKPCSFEGLYGIERPLARLQAMIRRFLARQPFCHILLWGARGMGKSSSALALLQEFAPQGLRLIEVSQRNLAQLPALFPLIQTAKERFVLFLDDFGFTLGNPEYKALKSIFEGSLEQMPENLLVLATSNKKDLVALPQTDPSLPQSQQAEDEARALDDRFGLKLYFEQPQFDHLKELFQFILKKQGRAENAEALWPEFLQFARLQGHDKPSARTIEQFLTKPEEP